MTNKFIARTAFFSFYFDYFMCCFVFVFFFFIFCLCGKMLLQLEIHIKLLSRCFFFFVSFLRFAYGGVSNDFILRALELHSETKLCSHSEKVYTVWLSLGVLLQSINLLLTKLFVFTDFVIFFTTVILLCPLLLSLPIRIGCTNFRRSLTHCSLRSIFCIHDFVFINAFNSI